jgi:tRNA1Val (adenine37-N6)-methyltransferase
MSSNSFRFQQFEVFHDRCGMKVGTDAVLLAAWVETAEAVRILDVGTGCGLIALILAQRSKAQLVGLELDLSAFEQASSNVLHSPWSDRVKVIQHDFTTFSDDPFDLIVSNPPFFQQSLQAPSAARNNARHDVTLNYTALIRTSAALLTQNGRFSVVLPHSSAEAFEAICWDSRLFLKRSCAVSAKSGGIPNRILMEFSTVQGVVERSTLFLMSEDGIRSEAYSSLTSDLYLRP